MNFSKVKLIIILCLAIVNVIFAFLCIRLISETNYISEEEAALASSNLLKNGMEVEFDKDARRLYDLPVYISEGVQQENYIPVTYKRLTESFFGTKIQDAAYVKTPDGYSVSVKDDKGVPMGSSSLSGNTDFECFSVAGESYKDSPELYSIPFFNSLERDKSDEYAVAESFVVSAFKNYAMKFVYMGSRELSDGRLVSFSGELSDTTVISVYINVFVKDGSVACCTGKVFDIAPKKKYSTTTVDSIDAVYLLAAHIRRDRDETTFKGSQIEEISMVYDSVEYSYGEYYIIPTWIIRYKDNEGTSVIYSVDAINAEGIRELPGIEP